MEKCEEGGGGGDFRQCTTCFYVNYLTCSVGYNLSLVPQVVLVANHDDRERGLLFQVLKCKKNNCPLKVLSSEMDPAEIRLIR
jgi:hypothetical protein